MIVYTYPEHSTMRGRVNVAATADGEDPTGECLEWEGAEDQIAEEARRVIATGNPRNVAGAVEPYIVTQARAVLAYLGAA